MDKPVDCGRLWGCLQHGGRWGLAVVLLILWGLILADHTAVLAAESPDKGGTIIWAVHEGMPSFDIHFETHLYRRAARWPALQRPTDIRRL